MSTETETDTEIILVGKLTKEDIKAFKIADVITFFWEGNTSWATPLHKGLIRLTKRKSGTGWTNAESDYEIAAAGSLTRYRSHTSAESSCEDKMSCRSWHSSVKHDQAIQTIISLMRVGDIIRMNWIANNDCDLYRQYGFVCDELSVILIRGKTALQFNIDRYDWLEQLGENGKTSVMAKVGDTVTILPGDTDKWDGKAIIREVSINYPREHLVQIVATGAEVWFDQQRFVELLSFATCTKKSLVHCRPKWCKHCFRQDRNLAARQAEKLVLIAKWNSTQTNVVDTGEQK